MGVPGPGSLDSAPVLQTLLRRELADAREYQQLSRRASGPPARMLAALSGEKKHWGETPGGGVFPHLRRALLAGGGEVPAHALVLRHPAPPLRPGAAPTMAAYLTGIETTDDPCLRQLFYELAQGAWDHACKVRELVEMA